jgi:ABC-type transporter Mla MlaB component
MLGAITLKLEGGLSGPWLQELAECWQRSLERRDKPVLRVDLSKLTVIDRAGEACLANMYRHGAEFISNDCLTRVIVTEFTQAHLRDGGERIERTPQNRSNTT